MIQSNVVCSYCAKQVVRQPDTDNWYHLAVPYRRNSMTFEVDGVMVTGSRYCEAYDRDRKNTNRKAKPNAIPIEREFDNIEDEIADLDRLEAEAGLREPLPQPRRSTYKVKLLFYADPDCPGDMPLVGSALDEYTIDNWNGQTPDYYLSDVETCKGMADTMVLREMWVEIPEAAVKAMFETPTVQGNT